MKQLRTKSTVLLNAQTGKQGIAVVRMEEFKFIGSSAISQIGYYEQVEDVNAAPGSPKYKLNPLPVIGAINGRFNVKRVTLSKPQMDGLFTMIDKNIVKTLSFSDQLSGVLTESTMIQMVMDKNYRKVDENNKLTELTGEDWEVVLTQELVPED